jgi:hypothetical protein
MQNGGAVEANSGSGAAQSAANDFLPLSKTEQNRAGFRSAIVLAARPPLRRAGRAPWLQQTTTGISRHTCFENKAESCCISLDFIAGPQFAPNASWKRCCPP